MAEGNKSNKSVLIIVIAIIIIGGVIGTYFALKGGEETNTNKAATDTTKNTSAEKDVYADFMKYDGKIWNITSDDGKVEGRVGIKIDKTQDYFIRVAYFFKVNDDLPKTSAATGGGTSYYYIANNVPQTRANTEGRGTGALSTIFCHKDTMIDVLELTKSLSDPTEVYLDCEERLDPYHTTSTFYHTYAAYYNAETFKENEIVQNTLLEVYDTAPFYKEDTETGGWGADDTEVIAGSQPVAYYNLIFSEQ